MAELQYVGARYVPLFFTNPNDGSNNWLAGYTYDPLTIVTDINQSYTSKIPVPSTVGRPSENPQYWALTGAYNAQVEEYRREVVDVSNEITEVDNKIKSISVYTNRKFLILGDSLSDTNLTMSSPNWVTYFEPLVNALGATIVNNSSTGRSLSVVRTDNLAAALETITDADTFTDIILFLGVNDWASNATLVQLANALNVFQNWHVANNPSAIVHMITPPRSAVTFNPDNALSFVRCAMVNYGAKHYRWQIIDAYNEAPNFDGMNYGLSNLWTVDGLHFKPSYAETFANYIFDRIQSGTSNLITIGAEVFNITSTITGVNLEVFYYDNGEVGFHTTFPANYTPSSTLVNLGTLPVFARPFRVVSSAFYYASGGAGKRGIINIKTTGVVYAIFEDTNAVIDAEPNFFYKSSAVFGTTE